MKLYPFQRAYHAVPPCNALWPLPAGRACFAGRRVDIYGANPNIGPISQLLATVVVDFHLIPSRESLKVLLFTSAIFWVPCTTFKESMLDNTFWIHFSILNSIYGPSAKSSAIGRLYGTNSVGYIICLLWTIFGGQEFQFFPWPWSARFVLHHQNHLPAAACRKSRNHGSHILETCFVPFLIGCCSHC